MSDLQQSKHSKASIFNLSVGLTLIVVALAAIFPSSFQTIASRIQSIIGTDFGWFYLLLTTAIVFCCIFLLLSPVGQIKLGDPHSQPEHSTLSWFAMLFSAGMGIGLVFWGAAEPLSHYAVQAPEGSVGNQQALMNAFKYTFFHWGIHAWAVYAMVALALAYFKFRKQESTLLSATLKPLFGNKVNGWLGKIVDVITIFATVVSVATTLGFGAVQINGGLSYLWGVPKNITVQILIIIITTGCFILSALSGVGKGVKILSNINLILAVALLAIAFIIADPVNIMNTLVESIGNYLQDFIHLSLRTAASNPSQQTWIQNWTIFYWAWWLAWSPFVGMFIARISKGRTIREFLLGVILVPALLSCFWFTVFGTLSIHTQQLTQHITDYATEEVLFATFSHYPLGMVLSIIAIILIFTFFITSADSATFVLAMISEKGKLNPHNKTKLVWGFLLAVIAIILLMAGGLNALQSVLIIVAFPFSIILLLVIVSLFKELKHEQKEMGLMHQARREPDKNHPFKSYE